MRWVSLNIYLHIYRFRIISDIMHGAEHVDEAVVHELELVEVCVVGQARDLLILQ